VEYEIFSDVTPCFGGNSSQLVEGTEYSLGCGTQDSWST